MLSEADGAESVEKSSVSIGKNGWKQGRHSVEYDGKWSSDENVQTGQNLVPTCLRNPSVVQDMNLDKQHKRRILWDGQCKKQVSAQMFPRLFTDEWKQRRAGVCSDLSMELPNNAWSEIINEDTE